VKEGFGVGNERRKIECNAMEAPLPTQSQATPITQLRVSNA